MASRRFILFPMAFLLYLQNHPIFCLLTDTEIEPVRTARTVNVDQKYTRWPKRNRIPYTIDTNYSPSESAQIRTALDQITSDLNYWVTFVAVPPSSNEYKIKITALRPDGFTPEKICYSYPGMLAVAPKLPLTGVREQRLVLARGDTGCFDGSLRSVMKYLAMILGIRNEHQRGDRADWIEMYPGNFTAVGRVAYREYLDTETYWKLFPYDYCSITHNQPEEFALPGTAAFTVLKPPFFIPKLDHLSESDCRTLLMLYNGDPSACTPVDCAAFMPPVAVSTPPTRTTLSVTKGPSPANTTMSLDAADTTMRTTQPTAEFLKDNSKSATKKTGVVDSVTGAPTSIACPSVVCPVCTCATHAPCPTTAARPMIKIKTASIWTTGATTVIRSSPPSTTETTTDRFVATETVNPCPPKFCSGNVDHGALYLDGESSALFFGECVQKIDNSFGLVGNPVPLSDVIASGLVSGPLQSVWTDMNAGRFRMHVIDNAGTQQICTATRCDEEKPSKRKPASSIFAVQSGDTATFRIFTLDNTGTMIIDETAPEEPIRLEDIRNGTATPPVKAIVTAWMMYNQRREKIVALVVQDDAGQQYISELHVDLEKQPAVFSYVSDPVLSPLFSKIHPCP